MKKLITVLIIITCTSTVFGQYSGSSFRAQSYYGFSGLTFIPTAQTLSPGQLGFSYLAKPSAGADLTLEPFSVTSSFGPKIKGLELAMTNTPFYASSREFGGVFISHGHPELNASVAPIFLSLKYQILPMTTDNHHVAMAIGFGLPYGVYYVTDKFFDLEVFDVTLHSGVGTKLTTYHAFAGLTFTFGKRRGAINRDFPLEMLIEGSWGGSLKQLNEKEEAFLAISFRLAWTQSLFMSTFFRIDDQPLYDEFRMIDAGPTKRMGIGLNYTLF